MKSDHIVFYLILIFIIFLILSITSTLQPSNVLECKQTITDVSTVLMVCTDVPQKSVLISSESLNEALMAFIYIGAGVMIFFFILLGVYEYRSSNPSKGNK